MKDLLYRVIPEEGWPETLRCGEVPLCGADQRDGFVHLSTEDTVLQTAALYFTPEESPIVLEISSDGLGDALRWEEVESRDGERFPHLYAPGIPLTAIRARIELIPDDAGGTALGLERNGGGRWGKGPLNRIRRDLLITRCNRTDCSSLGSGGEYSDGCLFKTRSSFQ